MLLGIRQYLVSANSHPRVLAGYTISVKKPWSLSAELSEAIDEVELEDEETDEVELSIEAR